MGPFPLQLIFLLYAMFILDVILYGVGLWLEDGSPLREFLLHQLLHLPCSQLQSRRWFILLSFLLRHLFLKLRLVQTEQVRVIVYYVYGALILITCLLLASLVGRRVEEGVHLLLAVYRHALVCLLSWLRRHRKVRGMIEYGISCAQVIRCVFWFRVISTTFLANLHRLGMKSTLCILGENLRVETAVLHHFTVNGLQPVVLSLLVKLCSIFKLVRL